MSFFIKGKQTTTTTAANSKQKSRKRQKQKSNHEHKNNEVISSDEEIVIQESLPSSEDETETAQEKKIRLAKAYLEEIKIEEERHLQNKLQESSSEDLISKRLKEDYLKQAGKLKTLVADNYCEVDISSIQHLKCREHKNTVTCICVSSDNEFIYSGSKDSGIVKWSLSTMKYIKSIPHRKATLDRIGHSRKILCIAITTDSRFLAVGDESKEIQIWNPEDLTHINTLKGHQNSVTGLVFKKGSHILYSCSKDRSIRTWSLDEMAYIETLFGHQDGITDIDALMKERALTAGGRDCTIRLWKIVEESQLVFNGHSGSIDTVRLVNEETFISGGDDGQLCVWSILKKKPLCTVKEAHGCNPLNGQPYWICSVASLQNTDLIASGSQDGFVKLWKLGEAFRSVELIIKIPLKGFVNALVFTTDGAKLVAGIGQEHKYGRWDVISVKNSVAVIHLLKT